MNMVIYVCIRNRTISRSCEIWYGGTLLTLLAYLHILYDLHVLKVAIRSQCELPMIHTSSFPFNLSYVIAFSHASSVARQSLSVEQRNSLIHFILRRFKYYSHVRSTKMIPSTYSGTILVRCVRKLYRNLEQVRHCSSYKIATYLVPPTKLLQTLFRSIFMFSDVRKTRTTSAGTRYWRPNHNY